MWTQKVFRPLFVDTISFRLKIKDFMEVAFLTPLTVETVIVAVPGAFAVTFPVEETVTIISGCSLSISSAKLE